MQSPQENEIAGIDFTCGDNTQSPRVVILVGDSCSGSAVVNSDFSRLPMPGKPAPDRGINLRDIICGRPKVKQLRKAK